jgi:hypothetical protein
LSVGLTATEKQNIFGQIIDEIKREVDDPKSILIAFFALIIFYIIILCTGISMTREKKPFTIAFFEFLHWFFLLLFLICDIFKYIFKINLGTIVLNKLYSSWQSLPDESEIVISQEKILIVEEEKEKKDEVFNISKNIYTYEDAKDVCKSYDSRLATYDEVEKSYEAGGEWCNYGWSDNQMILFPTQKQTWNTLQLLDGEDKNKCGRPGINGGYMEDPEMLFGVNCIGKKPPQKESEKKNENDNHENIPKTRKEIAIEEKIKYWKDNEGELLKINSFNKKKWAQY